MTQPGGSANINGILYEILGCIHWAAKISLVGCSAVDSDLQRAILIIEPVGGGGDIQIRADQKRIVEQWKAKSNQGSWSLKELVEDVLPDLYRAIDASQLQKPVVYRFVTEGHRGVWDKAQTFFTELNADTIPPSPLSSLDDTEKLKFFPKEEYSRKEFFLQIAQALKKHEPAKSEDDLLTQTKLWHLLSHFEFQERVNQSALLDKLKQQIRDIVDHVDDLDAKVSELCGNILRLAASGEVSLKPAELFQQVGLRAKSFRDWTSLLQTMQDRLVSRLKLAQYVSTDDVRGSPDWPAEKQILIVAGESGQGKTWQLAKLALDQSASGRLCAWVKTDENAERDLTNAANEVWQHGLRHDNQLALSVIAARQSEVSGSLAVPWLTVFIDDVLTTSEARRLVEKDWKDWRIQLAFTAPPFIARAIKSAFPEDVHVVDVPDFSVHQLNEYLERRGRNWATLPSDVRDTLRRPLLAKLYCDLASEWTPATEYELYERYWNRITSARNQPDYVQDIALMRRLAATVLEASTTYPWTQEKMLDLGIDSSAQQRLESIGWLCPAGNNRMRVWHDRLLNWAVAEALVQQRVDNIISVGQLTDQVRKLSSVGIQPQPNHWRLRYVPADVLWLVLSERNTNLNPDALQLMAAIEGDRGSHAESFYIELLPTLGPRIIKSLIDRLRSSKQDGWNPYPRYIATALVKIAKVSQNKVNAVVTEMLDDPLAEIQECATRILSKLPNSQCLDRLWSLHGVNHASLRNEENPYRDRNYQTTWRAMRACVALDPQWLVNKITTTIPKREPVSELAWLMASLSHPESQKLWCTVKGSLFRDVPGDRPRCLVYCILRYHDKDEIARLESWLGEEKDALGGAAFSVLAAILPDRAIARLRDVPLSLLSLMREDWLPELLMSSRAQVQRAIREWMRSSSLEQFWRIALIYSGQEDEIDTETIDEMFSRLQQLLESTNKIPWNAVRLIASVRALTSLKRFTILAGGPLETKLTHLVCEQIIRGESSFEIDAVREILLKIGGEGFTRFINCQLESRHSQIRLEGLSYAVMRPNAETIARLRAIVMSDVTVSGPGEPYPLEQSRALRVLAAVGEDQAVIDGLLKWGSKSISEELVEIRSQRGEMDNAALVAAKEVFSDSNDTARRNATIALGLSLRSEWREPVWKVFKAAAPESDMAYDALFALGYLRENSESFIQVLKSQMSIAAHRNGAFKILARIDSPAVLDFLEHSFLMEKEDILGEYRWNTARALCHFPDRRAKILPRLWRDIKDIKGPQQLVHNVVIFGCYEFLGDLDQQEVKEFLWNRAYEQDHDLHYSARVESALRGISRFDPEAAFQATVTEFSEARPDRELLPNLLMAIDQDQAIPQLCSIAKRERSTQVRWQIARALSGADNLDLLLTCIRDMFLATDDEGSRSTACELAGWLTPGMLKDELAHLMATDFSLDVRMTARKSLKHQRETLAATELTKELSTAAGCQQWCYVKSILGLANAYLLLHEKDIIGFRKACSGLPASIIQHVREDINKSYKKLDAKAEELDRKQNSDL